MVKRIATWLAFWTALVGIAMAVIVPAGCLFWIPCHVNAGSQLGTGVAGVVGGGLLAIWWFN